MRDARASRCDVSPWDQWPRGVSSCFFLTRGGQWAPWSAIFDYDTLKIGKKVLRTAALTLLIQTRGHMASEVNSNARGAMVSQPPMQVTNDGRSLRGGGQAMHPRRSGRGPSSS